MDEALRRPGKDGVVKMDDAKADDAIVREKMFGERGGAVEQLRFVARAPRRADRHVQRANRGVWVGRALVEQLFGFGIVEDVGHVGCILHEAGRMGKGDAIFRLQKSSGVV